MESEHGNPFTEGNKKTSKDHELTYWWVPEIIPGRLDDAHYNNPDYNVDDLVDYTFNGGLKRDMEGTDEVMTEVDDIIRAQNNM